MLAISPSVFGVSSFTCSFVYLYRLADWFPNCSHGTQMDPGIRTLRLNKGGASRFAEYVNLMDAVFLILHFYCNLQEKVVRPTDSVFDIMLLRIRIKAQYYFLMLFRRHNCSIMLFCYI